MQSFPHLYHANTSAKSTGEVDINSEGLTTIHSAPPTEFGGDGNHWSPETLLVAAVADCFCLSFRAIAQGFKLPWQSLHCKAEGVLDRVNKVTQFTGFTLHAKLCLTNEADIEKAKKVLQKAEDSCLITNSLRAESHLTFDISIAS